MPTYVLEGGKSISLPNKPVTIRLQSSRAGAVRLEAAGEDQQVRSISPAPGLLVVPQVPGPVTVRAVPADGERFGSGSVLNLVVGYESRQDLDPDRGVLNGLDVSGLRHRDVVLLEPNGDRVTVTVLGPPAAEAPLPAGAALARDAARELLGTDQLPSRQAVRAVVAVDVSASMRPLLADGSVAQVLDILAGVHRVVGRAESTSLRGCLAAGQVRWLPPTPPERFATETLAAARDVPLFTGFRAAAAVAGPPAGLDGPAAGSEARTVTWLVTDGVPAEAAALAGTGAHLVCLLPNSAREVPLGQGLPTTVVGLSDQVGQPPTFGQDRTVVTEIVASLLASLRSPAANPASSVATDAVPGGSPA